ANNRPLFARLRNTAFGTQPGKRRKQRKIRSPRSDSGCLPCFWVGFPPAPRFQLLAPTKLPNPPLSTTLYHILAVSRLLSSRNLQVHIPLIHEFRKSRRLVVNQFEHHNP